MSQKKPFERENRYIVLKVSDAKKHLSHVGWDELKRVCHIVEIGREKSGKAPALECVVVEKDWPEYEPVWAMIQKRCTSGTLPSVGDWWTHHNGNRYEVVLLSNEDSDNPDYPVTVSYRGENGKVWSKTLENFLAKMTPLAKS